MKFWRVPRRNRMNLPDRVIQLQINGEAHRVPIGQPLAELITGLGLPPQAVLIEHNGRALFRSDWEHVQLAEGDRLEVLRVVAGG